LQHALAGRDTRAPGGVNSFCPLPIKVTRHVDFGGSGAGVKVKEIVVFRAENARRLLRDERHAGC
jgi:hypothetical protein